MPLYRPNFVVISGGPGCGKTTVLAELSKLGFPHAPEVARQIIQEQVNAGGTALPWNNRKAFTDLMLQRSIESYLEHAPTRSPIFTDRGIPDTLGYAWLIGLEDTGEIEGACREYRYAPLVFLAPPWEEIYKTDSERKQDFAEARRTYSVLVDVYRECGYEVQELPKAAPVERARHVLEQLHLKQLHAVETGPR
jgi:predicted ATPase